MFMQRENAVLKHQLNRRAQKKDGQGRRIQTSLRVVTSEQGMQEATADRAAWDKKERKAAEKHKKKSDQENDNLVRQATQGATMIFTGSLGSKNKTELQDLATALNLSIEGTKPDLTTRISAHFNEHPDLKAHERFVSLFGRHGQKRPAPIVNNAASTSDTAIAPPSQHR